MPRPDEAQNLHFALLVSLSKAVIAQAETEVTAHKAQAGPLARVAVSLIIAYPPLADIFFARMCARVGCWAAGVEPLTLENETWEQLQEKEKQKRWGARSDENLEEKMMRIAGVMRLYFAMLFVALKLGNHVPAPFRPARFWLYLAQLLNNRKMLERPVAPEIIYGMFIRSRSLSSRLTSLGSASCTRRRRSACESDLGQAVHQDASAPLRVLD